MNKLALFDCDGTLVDSQHNIVLRMNDAFARAGLAAPDREATKRIVGLSLLPAMQALLPDAEHALHFQLAEDYKTAFQRLRFDGLVEEPLFDGIAEVLDALEADGWLLGVATGKSDRGLDLCLRHHGLKDRFVTLQTADRHPSKPHPSMVHEAMADAGATPKTTVMIGDTSFDMAMGVAAGARSLGVDWGYHGVDDLLDAGAFHIASHPAHILEVLTSAREEEQARIRYNVLNIVRFSGVALVFAGIANIAGKLLPDLAPWFGYVLFFLGIFEFYTLPILLKRHWRGPKP